jgi:hypothetical protein
LKRTQRGPHFALEVLVAEDRSPTDRVGLDVFPYQLVGVLPDLLTDPGTNFNYDHPSPISDAKYIFEQEQDAATPFTGARTP